MSGNLNGGACNLVSFGLRIAYIFEICYRGFLIDGFYLLRLPILRIYTIIEYTESPGIKCNFRFKSMRVFASMYGGAPRFSLRVVGGGGKRRASYLAVDFICISKLYDIAKELF